ncbi:unnamed protein product [Prorocentrum cordatum]|uniref:DUF1565 domain-containing protein n=1 Tax=Prorocentrum cordatum TaxID=2364126 RepID=A0ABN9TH23_9DINO|nr:unnamed protein product [Polarella glacialis]
MAAAEAEVPAGFDCAMRHLAVDFARRAQPSITQRQLEGLADALNGAPEARCRNVSAAGWRHAAQRSAPAAPGAAERSVFASPSGDDASAGTISAPLRTIAAAVASARRWGAGVGRTVFLRAGVYREAGAIQLTAADSGLTIAAYAAEEVWISGAKEIFPTWRLFSAKGGKNIWVTDVASSLGPIRGLRVGGRRAVRARYPNSDPETDLNPAGWVSTPTRWLSPRVTHVTDPPVEYVVDAPEWTRQDSTGNEVSYRAGINGSCRHLEPPYGYWCSGRPSRAPDGSLTHRWPSGLVFEGHLPHAPYKDPAGAIVHSCRGGANCWFTWMFEVDAQSVENKTLSWSYGGFQGAEGDDAGGTWYIENVLEELDVANEFFHDSKLGLLYYFHNASSGTPPPPSLTFEAATLKVLLNATGSMREPVVDVTIRRIKRT